MSDERGTVFLGASAAQGRKRGCCLSEGRFRERHPSFGVHEFGQTCVKPAGHDGEHWNGSDDEYRLTWAGAGP